MGTIAMYELDNEQPDGIDIPDDCNTFKNQYILENFLHKIYPVQLDWGNKDMKFLVLIESGSNIVGMSAMIPYKRKSKVHLCVMAISRKWRKKGMGTEMLKHIAVMYPQKEITLSVPFDQPDVLNFYLKKCYAEMKSIDTEKKCFVLSLVNIKLLSDVSLPL
jgi:hypothetical protein